VSLCGMQVRIEMPSSNTCRSSWYGS
jgi:hypothetical protein